MGDRPRFRADARTAGCFWISGGTSSSSASARTKVSMGVVSARMSRGLLKVCRHLMLPNPMPAEGLDEEEGDSDEDHTSPDEKRPPDLGVEFPRHHSEEDHRRDEKDAS